MYIPLGIAMALFARNKFMRIAGFLLACSLSPVLIWNSSRTSWFSVLAASLFVSFLHDRKKLLFISCVIGAAVIFLTTRYTDKLLAVINPMGWGNRVELWKSAFAVWQDFPILGAGTGMYEKLLYTYGSSAGYSEGFGHLHAHNVYLEVAAETGIIGLAAFCAVFVSLFKRVRAVMARFPGQDDLRAFIIGLSGLVFSSLLLAFTSTVIIVGVHDVVVFWFSLGLLSGLITSM